MDNDYYNLEERTFQFAKKCRDFVKRLPRTISNTEAEMSQLTAESVELMKIFGSMVINKDKQERQEPKEENIDIF